ncbi:MAG TPA: cupin domain-containing protein [Stellaceae bacterium]|jgi:quercetin dioxygenase-like cupin family protein|nr:cupin domain-containing protein [Stellaceae bacterium]
MKIRRIVTGHDVQGRSLVTADSIIDSHPGKMDAAIAIADLWLNALPPSLDGADPAQTDFPVLPGNGGAVFRILELMPGTAPHMHKTATIDYIVVLAGTVSMLLDDGTELTMKPHDTMIQRATVHGWANRGTEPCRFATVVIDATGSKE